MFITMKNIKGSARILKNYLHLDSFYLNNRQDVTQGQFLNRKKLIFLLKDWWFNQDLRTQFAL